MEPNDNFFNALYDNLVLDLEIIDQGTLDVLTLTGLRLDTVYKSIIALKEYVLEKGFVNSLDEIHFFKIIKPKFYSLLVFYGKIYELELNRPAAGRDAEKDYLKKEEYKLLYFFEKHKDFYQYYRTGSNYLDNHYFLRNSKNIISSIGVYGIDTDPGFTTGQDFIVSKIEANERLRGYIEHELSQLIYANANTSNDVESQLELNWTASKASLIELIYGLHTVGAFNNGSIGLGQIALYFEKKFHVRLGNFHRGFQEVRARKKNRTQFLDEIRKKLIDKMNYLDENPSY